MNRTTRVALAAAVLVALPACAADRSGSASGTASPTAAADPPYVVVQHQVEPGLLSLHHLDGELWATRRAGVSTIDLRTGDVTELPDFGQVAEAHAFALGGGHLWVPDFERSSLTRIRIEDQRVESIPVLKNSDAVSYGFGSVWVSNHRSSSVQRLDPDSGRVTATVVIGTGKASCCGPSASVPAFGRVWVAVPFLRGVAAIDPGTDRVAATPVIEDGGCSVCGDLAATGESTPSTADDGVWGVGDTGLHRIDPHRADLVGSVPLGFPDDSGSEGELAATPDGVFVSASGGRLLLVDATTTKVMAEVELDPEARNVQLELAYGGGLLWAYERFTGRLWGIDPALVAAGR